MTYMPLTSILLNLDLVIQSKFGNPNWNFGNPKWNFGNPKWNLVTQNEKLLLKRHFLGYQMYIFGYQISFWVTKFGLDYQIWLWITKSRFGKIEVKGIRIQITQCEPETF